MLEEIPNSVSSAASDWFVFRVRPRHEKTVALRLRDNLHDCFLPLTRLKRQWGKRTVKVELPLFPGYVFCLADQLQLLSILKTAGVMDVVRVAGTPTPVKRNEVEAIARVVACNCRTEACNYIDAGQKVGIVDGPLAGLCGYLVQVRDRQRLVLSLTLLQRSILVEIDTAAVLALSQSYSFNDELARCEAALQTF